jgi:hypothetical protein
MTTILGGVWLNLDERGSSGIHSTRLYVGGKSPVIAGEAP